MHQPGLSANLDSFDLLDLVQVIQMTRRNISLAVRSGSQRLGMLRFSQGELLWAEFGALRGEEAFMALAALHSGNVEELAGDERTDRNVNQPLSRLVMQAVEYRETHEHPQPLRTPTDSRSRPIQPPQPSPVLSRPYDRFAGPESSPRPGITPPGPLTMAPEGEAAPSWVREIHAAQAEPPPFSSFLREEMAVQIPEPTLPVPTPNGKVKLSAPPANGNKPMLAPPDEDRDDPPTVPLRSVQGGLLSYAPKREPAPPEPPRESPMVARPSLDPLPGQAAIKTATPVASAPLTPPPAAAVPPPPPPVPDEMLPDTAPLVPPSPPAAPPAEPPAPKMSSMAILEQLAYGGLSHNGYTETPVVNTPAPAPVLAPPAFVSPAPPANGATTPAPAVPEAEKAQNVQEALETFAEQVGSACIATAVIRADGLLLAEYKVRRGLDQDLASPAYHMAHVMQSSLRALLMGGWGDLEDTFISGSTHSVMLRRLGRADKGLYHVAVLERSGNPGLCRVRMRNNEALLLQMLSVDLPAVIS